jgi:hypothetical protein
MVLPDGVELTFRQEMRATDSDLSFSKLGDAVYLAGLEVLLSPALRDRLKQLGTPLPGSLLLYGPPVSFSSVLPLSTARATLGYVFVVTLMLPMKLFVAFRVIHRKEV